MRAITASGIYLITCNRPAGLPLYYVGQSIDTRSRMLAHRSALRNNRHHNDRLQRAWEKYGSENFVFSLIGQFAIADLDSIELWFITEMLGAPGCCNIGTDPSQPNRGRKFSHEHRRKIAAAHTAENHYSYGLPLSDAHRANISAGGKGVKRGCDTRLKISKANAGSKNSMFGKTGLTHVRSKPVIGTCLETGDVITFDSANLARSAGFDQGAISRCCSGISKFHKGYSWCWKAMQAQESA